MYSAFLTRCIRRGEAGRLADRLNLSETGQPVEVTPEGTEERRNRRWRRRRRRMRRKKRRRRKYEEDTVFSVWTGVAMVTTERESPPTRLTDRFLPADTSQF